MKIEQTALGGVVVLTPRRHEDARGFFSEAWNKQTLQDVGISVEFVQDNHSLSKPAGTVRGLHFQTPPHAQTKLVRCAKGSLFDVVVDIRRGSPTYGHWVGEELSFNNGKQVFVPAGFLHGFMTLEPDTEIAYKCSDYYDPGCDGAIHWKSCGVEWPRVEGPPLLSDKDMAAPPLSDFASPFRFPEGTL